MNNSGDKTGMRGDVKAVFKNLFDKFSVPFVLRLTLYSVLIGIVAGFGAILFAEGIELVQNIFLERGAGYIPPGLPSEGGSTEQQGPSSYLLFLVPAIGGLLAGLIVMKFAPEAEGDGTDAMIRSFHRKQGNIRRRIPFVKGIASMLTIGSGGSAGREGPISQIGAGFGSFLGSLLKVTPKERRILMLAGASGGLGGVFRAPLGGALFATEVLYGGIEMEIEAIVPAIISSIVSYSICASVFGWEKLFIIPPMEFQHPAELLVYLVFGLLCAGLGWVYVESFNSIKKYIFDRITIPRMLKPALGGLFVGIIGLGLPHIFGGGYGWIQKAIDGNLALSLTVTLIFAKIIATGLTISSGGSGGVFAPSLFIGAMLGSSYAQLVEKIIPGFFTQPAALVVVGMGGFFAGVAKVPLAALILVAEMTGSYGLMVPMIFVAIVAYLFSRRHTLYKEQVNSRLDSPAHIGSFVIDVLEGFQVQDILTNRTTTGLSHSTPLEKIFRILPKFQGNSYPVMDDENRYLGFFTLEDFRTLINEEGLALQTIIAYDLVRPAGQVLVPNDSLEKAIRDFARYETEELPVTAPDDSHRLIGFVSRHDAITHYLEEVSKRKKVD